MNRGLTVSTLRFVLPTGQSGVYTVCLGGRRTNDLIGLASPS